MALVASLEVSAQAGNLDPSFGGTGLVTTLIEPAHDRAYGMAIQPDGKVVLAGYRGGFDDVKAVVLRYTVDGALDSTFGQSGITEITVPGRSTEITAVRMQSDNKIVVAGSAADMLNGTDIMLARLLADGTLDPEFGGTGVITSGLVGLEDRAFDLRVQPDGKLLACGVTWDAAYDDTVMAHTPITIVRYTTDGVLDPTFGSGGWVQQSFASVASGGTSMALGADGSITLVCDAINDQVQYSFGVARFLSDGTLDDGFGQSGLVVTQVGSDPGTSRGFAIALTSDGHVLVVGGTGSSLGMARYRSNGTLDQGFGTNGVVVATGMDIVMGYSVVETPDGKYEVGGISYDNNVDFALARFLPNGDPDTTFGLGGEVHTDVDGDQDWAFSLARDGDRLVLGGSAFIDGQEHFAAARYLDELALGIVGVDTPAHEILIYPDPVADFATLRYTSHEQDRYTLSLIDPSGRPCRIFFTNELRSGGPHSEPLDLSGITAGHYTLVLRSANGSASIRLVKK